MPSPSLKAMACEGYQRYLLKTATTVSVFTWKLSDVINAVPGKSHMRINFNKNHKEI